MLKLIFNNRALWILEKALFALFIFALPFGTRKFILSELQGNDFFTFFVYLSDILLLTLFILWFWRGGLTLIFNQYKNIFLAASLFILTLLLSLLANYNVLSLYYFVRVAFGILLIFYICSSWKLHNKGFLLKIFIFSIVIQSLIAIGQFFLQSDINLKMLGEPDLAPDIAGAAKINVSFGKFIRSYGTLSHPNVLGAFLMTGIAALAYKIFFLRGKAIDYLFLALIAAALFFSFSRSAYLAFFVFNLLFVLYIFKFHKAKLKHLYTYLSALFTLIFLLTIFFKPFILERIDFKKDDGLRLRSFYNTTAIKMMKNNILLGVGPGNFTRELNNYLAKPVKNFWEFQPAHNVFLLVGAEGGVFLLLIFILLFLRLFYVSLKRAFGGDDKFAFFAIIFACFFILMSFDHYFWTIWQAFLLLCIILGITYGYYVSSVVQFRKIFRR